MSSQPAAVVIGSYWVYPRRGCVIGDVINKYVNKELV
jgi:hypothetical protein